MGAVVRAVVVTGVEGVAGVVLCGVDFASRGLKGILLPLASGSADVVVVAVVAGVPLAFATAASSSLMVSETVSLIVERPLRIVAGATIVIERSAGAVVAGVLVVLDAFVVVAGAVVAAGVALVLEAGAAVLVLS